MPRPDAAQQFQVARRLLHLADALVVVTQAAQLLHHRGRKAGPAAAAQYATVRPGITGLWQVSGRNETTFAGLIDTGASPETLLELLWESMNDARFAAVPAFLETELQYRENLELLLACWGGTLALPVQRALTV